MYIKYFKFLAESKKKRKKILNFFSQKILQILGKQKKGKPRANMHLMIAGILYYLKSGCTWEMLPNEFGPHQTVYGWYSRFCEEKLFQKIFIELKTAFYKKSRKKVARLCTDGSLAQHCRKNELSAHNPRNKNKLTVNRMMTTDQNGIPLDILVAHGAAHDSIFFETSIYNAREGIELAEEWYSHADKGFDSRRSRNFIHQLGGKAIIPHRQIGRFKGMKSQKDSHRFVVERTFSWMNSFKSLKVVFVKKADRIKEMTLLFANIVYLRRFSFNELSNLAIGRSE